MYCHYCHQFSRDGVYRVINELKWVGMPACKTCYPILKKEYPQKSVIWVEFTRRCHMCLTVDQLFQNLDTNAISCYSCLVKHHLETVSNLDKPD